MLREVVIHGSLSLPHAQFGKLDWPKSSITREIVLIKDKLLSATTPYRRPFAQDQTDFG